MEIRNKCNPCLRCGGTRFIMVSVMSVGYGSVQLIDGDDRTYDNHIVESSDDADVPGEYVDLNEDTVLPNEFERYGIFNNASASGIDIDIDICVGCGTATGTLCGGDLVALPETSEDLENNG